MCTNIQRREPRTQPLRTSGKVVVRRWLGYTNTLPGQPVASVVVSLTSVLSANECQQGALHTRVLVPSNGHACNRHRHTLRQRAGSACSLSSAPAALPIPSPAAASRASQIACRSRSRGPPDTRTRPCMTPASPEPARPRGQPIRRRQPLHSHRRWAGGRQACRAVVFQASPHANPPHLQQYADEWFGFVFVLYPRVRVRTMASTMSPRTCGRGPRLRWPGGAVKPRRRGPAGCVVQTRAACPRATMVEAQPVS